MGECLESIDENIVAQEWPRRTLAVYIKSK